MVNIEKYLSNKIICFILLLKPGCFAFSQFKKALLICHHVGGISVHSEKFLDKWIGVRGGIGMDSLWCIRKTGLSQTWAFTTHSLQKSKLNCIQKNVQCGLNRAASSDCTPFLPVQVLKWRELTCQVNGRLLTGCTVSF